VWAAGLIVALGAGVATAHGLYEVALAAGTPQALAWLYPLITDGLALVAYATTTRLAESGRRYAWTVVVIAAGLSGLTQASYLAGGVASAPPGLRFAIGAWPAVAAAVVAHLLFLLGNHSTATSSDDLHQQVSPLGQPDQATSIAGRKPAPTGGPHEPLAGAAVSVTGLSRATSTSPRETLPVLPEAAAPIVAAPGVSGPPRAVQPAPLPVVQALTSTPIEHGIEHPAPHGADPVVRPPAARDAAPARVRAQTAATGHATRHGQLPTVSELMALAQVARGTAATALKDLRTQQEQLTTTTTTDHARTNR
jgi:hypothetical protein